MAPPMIFCQALALHRTKLRMSAKGRKLSGRNCGKHGIVSDASTRMLVRHGRIFDASRPATTSVFFFAGYSGDIRDQSLYITVVAIIG
jgi:hypothetical protein